MPCLTLAFTLGWFMTQAVEVSEYYTHPMASDGDQKAKVDMRMVGFDVQVDADTLQHVNGHVAWLSNPRDHFSISPALPGGCGTFARVSDVAKLHTPKCRFATNAGLFDVHTKQCFGNIVSDGKVVQTVPLNETNVAFGIKDGKFVVGYVSPDDIAAGGFEELVAGLGWLVKDGKNFVDESWKQAYTAVQTSGKGDWYTRMRSGRTAVGHDAKGRLIIFQVDGDSRGKHSYGMTLNEVADHLIKHFNVTNAIAMDSGGSTSFAKDGQFLNYPSDQYPPSCPQLPPFECERPTSTALCIHDSEDLSDDPKLVMSFWSFGGVMVVAALAGSVVGGMAMMHSKKSRKNRDLEEELHEDKSGSEDSVEVRMA